MIFRCKYIDPHMGGHIYCRLFAAQHINQPWQALGSFNVRKGVEFDALCAAMSGVEFEEQKATTEGGAGL